MPLTIQDDEMQLVRQALVAALEVLKLHRTSETIFDLDGFVEYGGQRVVAALEDLLTKVEKVIQDS